MSRPSRQPSRQSLRGFTLAVLIPCLLFSAALSGWETYRDLYRVILNDGFEQKLDAVSTGVAAFINGEDHMALGRPTRLDGLAADPKAPLLWGLDAAEGRLVTVDMVSGGALPVGDLPIRDVRGLAYDAAHDLLITMQPASGTLLAFKPDSLVPRPIATIQPGGYALAVDASGKHLVVAGPWGLEGYDLVPSRRPLTPAWTMAADARAVAMSPRTGALFVLDRTGSLSLADSAGAPLQDVGPLTEDDDEDDAGALGEVQALTIGPLSPTIFGAANRLVAITPDARTFQVGKFRRGYRNEDSPTYKRYVQPMRRIRSDLDLTYLYTQDLVPGDSIEYILDSTPMGPDFSPIGTREALDTEADVRGYNDLMERGLVYSSAIENSVEWGLLKSAFAPILSARGDPVGMVGTDISVSTIRDRTQLALAKVGLVTVVILFLGGLGSVAISLRLTGPLAAVQVGATRVAAGRAGNPIDPPRLRDLATLTTSFNEMTRTLTSSVNDLREETQRVAARRTRRYLVNELATRRAVRDTLPDGVRLAPCEVGSEESPPGGFVVVGDAANPLVVVWCHGVGAAPLTALAEREEFALLARRLASAAGPGGASAADVVAGLERFREDDGTAFVVVDAARRTVWPASGVSVRGTTRDAGGAEERVATPAGEPFAVPAGRELTLTVASSTDSGEGKAGVPGWSVRVRGGSA